MYEVFYLDWVGLECEKAASLSKGGQPWWVFLIVGCGEWKEAGRFLENNWRAIGTWFLAKREKRGKGTEMELGVCLRI